MSQYDVAYSGCMKSLNDYYAEGFFIRMEVEDSKSWEKMLAFELELNKLWGGDYTVFRAVLIGYYRFMKGVLK